MNYNDFLIFLLKIGDLSLPGDIAHFRMSVPNRKKIFFDLDIKKKKSVERVSDFSWKKKAMIIYAK